MRAKPDKPDERTAEQDFLSWRQQGDASALARVFDRLAPELLLIAAHVAGRGSAEDMLQATFLHAIADTARWDATRPLLPWLVGILANLSLREREKAGRQPDPTRVTTPVAAADPHAEAEGHELAQAFAWALQGMPRHYRQVLTLRLVHGLEPAAIAHTLGAPPATVKSRLQRGLDLLRRALPAGLRLPAFAPWSGPSLATVREAVLAHGRAHVLATGLGATTLVLGGVLMMKKVTLVVVGLMLTVALALGVQHVLGASGGGAVPPLASDRAARVVATPRAAEPTAPVPLSRTPLPVDAPSATDAHAPEGRALRGRVVDEDGQPLVGVLVFLGDKGFSPFRDQRDFIRHSTHGHIEQDAVEVRAQLQRTTATGEFTLAEPTNQRPHLLVAWSNDRGCRAVDMPADLTRPVELVLPQDAVLRGALRNGADRAPVAQAAVQVWPAESGMPISYKHSDEHGRYALQPLPPGAYRMVVEREGFSPTDATFVLLAHQREQVLDLELAALPPFEPQLVGEDGLPWTRVRVGEAIGLAAPELRGVLSTRAFARRQEMAADSQRVQHLSYTEDGRLHGFVREPEERVLSVWHGGEKLFEVPAVDVAATHIVVQLLPRPTTELQVQIRFEPPAADVPVVELAITDPSGFGEDTTPIVVRTTREPYCSLPVPSNFVGKECGLLVRSAGRVTSFGIVAVPEQAVGAWREVVLALPTHRLLGVVVDPEGKPVPEGRVQLADVDGRWFLPPHAARGATDLDGAFQFIDLPRRRVRVFVTAEQFAPRSVEIDTGEAGPHSIELRRPRTVSVALPASLDCHQFRVLDALGRPLSDDRLSGTKRYGSGRLAVDLEAATIEVFDGITAVVVGVGPVTEGGKTVLSPLPKGQHR